MKIFIQTLYPAPYRVGLFNLLNENIVYNKIICINSCLSEDEIKTLNNEVI